VAILEKSRIYPLARKDDPPAMQFPNAPGVPEHGFSTGRRLLRRGAAAPENFAMRGMAALGI
jgi:hypothetical protein